MTISTIVRRYVEMALREKIARECQGYGPDTVERVVAASMNGMHVSKDVLYRAIELAARDKSPCAP